VHADCQATSASLRTALRNCEARIRTSRSRCQPRGLRLRLRQQLHGLLIMSMPVAQEVQSFLTLRQRRRSSLQGRSLGRPSFLNQLATGLCSRRAHGTEGTAIRGLHRHSRMPRSRCRAAVMQLRCHRNSIGLPVPTLRVAAIQMPGWLLVSAAALLSQGVAGVAVVGCIRAHAMRG